MFKSSLIDKVGTVIGSSDILILICDPHVKINPALAVPFIKTEILTEPETDPIGGKEFVDLPLSDIRKWKRITPCLQKYSTSDSMFHVSDLTLPQSLTKLQPT